MEDPILMTRFWAPTNTYGGGVDQTAVIGHAPEDRNWKPGDPFFPPEIDPTARIEAFCTIDAGKIRPTKVGARSWCFKHSHLGHDVWVEDDVEIASGAIIGGGCHIQSGAKIGLNAVVRPNTVVCEGARVGAGSVVIERVEPYTCVAGSPAKFIRYETSSDR